MPTFQEYNPEYLYLKTTGWKSGQRHEIEIWYIEHDGCYYLISEQPDKAHWIRNIRQQGHVSYWVLGQQHEGSARLIDDSSEPELAAMVRQLMQAKYQWSEGQVVELSSLS